MGEHWDRLRPTFESLAGRGDVQSVGPLVLSIPMPAFRAVQK